jgi:cupredoxin-like protein
MPRFTDTPRYALVLGGALVPLLLGAAAVRPRTSPTAVEVRLSEWKVEVSTAIVPTGPVVFHVANAGQIEHAFEVEGKGLERRTAPIAAGAEGMLNVKLKPGRYELYCPVGNGAHKQAGMKATIEVTAEESAPSSNY